MGIGIDFGALPPEINSSRMYSGPGSGPLLAAAAAWDQLARELSTSATAYRSVVAGLTTDSWRGPTSAKMSSAADRYLGWLHTTAAQAAQTATQAKSAAAAYQSALAMTVPPPLIVANRSRLATLAATNFFGQNSPAIAAAEAEYQQMWAQDAAAMHSYSGSASAASALTPFTDAPNLAAQAPAAAATPTIAPAPAIDPTTLLSLVLDIPSLTSAAASTSSSTFSGIAIQTTNHALAVNAMRDAHQGIGPFIAGAIGPASPTGPVTAATPISAVTGRASLVGTLSVPQAWAATETTGTTAPTAGNATLARPAITAAAPSTALPPGIFGEAMLGTLAGRGASNAAAKLRQPSVIPRSPAAG